MSEVKAIEAVDNALGALDAQERARVLGWAQLKYGAPAQITPTAHESAVPANSSAASTPPANAGTSAAKAKTTKKSKTIISMDKTLNLSPSGKPSAGKFAEEKSPSSLKEKCVVAVYYLRDIIGMQKVGA